MRLAPFMRWAGLAVVLAVSVTKASVMLETLPYWDLNPLNIWAPTLALGPAGSVMLDALLVCFAGVGLLGDAIAGRGVKVWMAALVGVGAIGCVLHATWLNPGIETMRIGTSWAAALCAGVALAHLCREESLARVAAGVLIGFVAMLCAKGVIQVIVEHPQTVADYEAGREAFLAARGWSPDSVMAKTFERRLYQVEATGWFGLSNVYASVAAGATAALIGLCIPAWIATRRETARIADGFAGLVTLGVILGGAALVMSRSLGGVGALGIGLGTLAVGAMSTRLKAERASWVGGVIGLGVIVVMLGGVVARGLIGERIGELSILFRWFYVEAAARIFAEHPMVGVGPAGFKDAYLLAKAPISPEEVASPHNVVFEHLATLGIFGIAWTALLIGLAWCCGRALTMRRTPLDAPDRVGGPSRFEGWMVVGVAAAASIVSVSVEAIGATPESMAARLAGLGAWVGVGLGVVVVARVFTAWRMCTAAAGLALLAHAMIEVSATWSGSAPLLLGLVGVGASGALEVSRKRDKPPMMDAGKVVSTGAILAGLLIGLLCVLPAMRWEGALTRAAMHAGVVAEFRGRLLALGPNGRAPDGDSVTAIARDLAATIGEPVAPADMMNGLGKLTVRQIDLASGEIVVALGVDQRHGQVLRVQSRLQLEAAAATTDAQERHERLTVAMLIAAGAASRDSSAPSWHWLGTVMDTIWEQEGDPKAMIDAMDAWNEAHKLDPHSLSHVERLYDACVDIDETAAARFWAAKALAIDRRMRLDPLRQLSEERRAELQRALGDD